MTAEAITTPLEFCEAETCADLAKQRVWKMEIVTSLRGCLPGALVIPSIAAILGGYPEASLALMGAVALSVHGIVSMSRIWSWRYAVDEELRKLRQRHDFERRSKFDSLMPGIDPDHKRRLQRLSIRHAQAADRITARVRELLLKEPKGYFSLPERI